MLHDDLLHTFCHARQLCDQDEFLVCAHATVASLRRHLARKFGNTFWPEQFRLMPRAMDTHDGLPQVCSGAGVWHIEGTHV